MRFDELEIVMQMGSVIRLEISLIVAALVDVMTIALLTACLHPKAAQLDLEWVRRSAIISALIAALPFATASAIEVSSVVLQLTRSAWIVGKVEGDLQLELSSASALLLAGVIAASPAAFTAGLAAHRSQQLARSAPLVPQRVRLAIIVVTAPWACAAWLLAFECVNALFRAWLRFPRFPLDRSDLEVLMAELLFLLLAATACFLPRQIARKSRLPYGPPAGSAEELSRFQALTNASGRATLRPTSHP